MRAPPSNVARRSPCAGSHTTCCRLASSFSRAPLLLARFFDRCTPNANLSPHNRNIFRSHQAADVSVSAAPAADGRLMSARDRAAAYAGALNRRASPAFENRSPPSAAAAAARTGSAGERTATPLSLQPVVLFPWPPWAPSCGDGYGRSGRACGRSSRSAESCLFLL